MKTELLKLVASINTQIASLKNLALECGVETSEMNECTDRQIATLSRLAEITQAEAETYA